MIAFKNLLPGSVVPYLGNNYLWHVKHKTDATSFVALSVQNCCSIWVVGGALKGKRCLSGADVMF